MNLLHRNTGEVIHYGDFDTKRELVLDAIAKKINLRGADFSGADYSGVDLSGVDLRGVDLRGVDLRGTNLRGAILHGVDLRGADFDRTALHNLTIDKMRLVTFSRGVYVVNIEAV